MAWSWSHTQEAYDAVREQIFAQDREWLEVVWAEWKTAKKDRHGCYDQNNFNQKKYERMLKRAKKFDNETLAEEIWNFTQEYATCSNGGWEAYCCPFDCGCHQIPFTPPAEEDEDDDDDLEDLVEDTD